LVAYHRGRLRLVIQRTYRDTQRIDASFLRLNAGLIQDDAKPSQSKHPVFRTSSLPTQKDPPLALPIEPVPDRRTGIVASNQQPEKKEKRPQKTGKALWKGVAAAVRFMVFAKRTPVGDRGPSSSLADA